MHAVGDLLQSVVVLDVVEGLDDGVVLFGILVDELDRSPRIVEMQAGGIHRGVGEAECCDAIPPS